MTPLLLALVGAAAASDYAFPSSPDDIGHYYPTAYKDHAGVDWNCGTIRYSGHQGSDFGAGSFTGMDDGRDVTAAAGGTVVTAHDGEFDRCTTGNCAGASGFGNYVSILHADGRSTYYAHLKQWSLQVAVGDTVSCGQKLGEMGSSGYSTGPHLHFEVRNSANIAEDPFDGPCSAPPTYWVDQGVYGDLPGGICADPPTCVPEQTLSCGDVVVDRNDGPGSTQATWQYGCSEFVYSGPERSYEVHTNLTEPVTVRVHGLAADLDVMAVVSTACDGSDCLATSSNPNTTDESLTVDAEAGVPFVLVVDGWEGAVSDFVLEVDCAGGPGGDSTPTGTTDTGQLPTTPTGLGSTGSVTADTGAIGDDDDDTLTGDDDDDDSPVGDDDDDHDDDTTPTEPTATTPPPKGGCGCQQRPGLPAVPWLLVAFLSTRRRRPS